MKIGPWIKILPAILVLMGLRPAAGEILADPVICAGPEFKIVSGEEEPYGKSSKWSWASYSCEKNCGSDWSKCAYACPDKEISWTCLAFVMDQMGGILRWSEDRGEPGPTVFVHPGGSGTGWRAGAKVIKQLIQDGVKVAQIKWEPGGTMIITSLKVEYKGGGGWFTRPDDNPSSIQKLSRRPGGMIAWTYKNLAPKIAKFGTVGCSGGALATSSPLYWHSIDDHTPLASVVDYQYLSGMASYYDFTDYCTRTSENPGICENDPQISCAKNSDCGAGKNECAFNELHFTSRYVIPIPDLVDYIASAPPDQRCYDGRIPPGAEQSSAKYSKGFTDFPNTKIDFNVNEGSFCLWFGTDTFLGATGGQGQIYRILQTESSNWHDNPGFHCASFADPKLVPETTKIIEKGLGLIKN